MRFCVPPIIFAEKSPVPPWLILCHSIAYLSLYVFLFCFVCFFLSYPNHVFAKKKERVFPWVLCLLKKNTVFFPWRLFVRLPIYTFLFLFVCFFAGRRRGCNTTDASSTLSLVWAASAWALTPTPPRFKGNPCVFPLSVMRADEERQRACREKGV